MQVEHGWICAGLSHPSSPREHSQWAAGGEEPASPALGAGPAPVAEALWRPGVAAAAVAVAEAAAAAVVVAVVAVAAAVVVAAAVAAGKTKEKGPSGTCLGNTQARLKGKGRSTAVTNSYTTFLTSA